METDANDDVLIKNHPVCNLNLVEHIKGFIASYNTIHYYNVVRKYIPKGDKSFMELEKNGIKPNDV